VPNIIFVFAVVKHNVFGPYKKFSLIQLGSRAEFGHCSSNIYSLYMVCRSMTLL